MLTSLSGIVLLSVDIPEVTINSSFESLLFLFFMLAAEGWCIIWQQARFVTPHFPSYISAFLILIDFIPYYHDYMYVNLWQNSLLISSG